MEQITQSSTAWLSVTELVNERWLARFLTTSEPHGSTPCDELLCSDAISIKQHQLKDPDFDAASFVLDAALAHTEQYCRQKQVAIPGFRSVEVLRFAQPTNGTLSFMFIMEPGATA